MSETAFLRAHDAEFFAAWADFVGGLDATYTPPGSAAPTACQVLVDHNIEQFVDGDDAPVSIPTTRAIFRREQVEPATGGTLVVDGDSYTLVQRVSGSDPSLSAWAVQKVSS